MQLVDTVMAEIGLDPTEVVVTMKYVLNSELPPIVIKNDNNVLSYMALKDMERDPSKYLIIIEVTEEDSQQNNAMLPFGVEPSGLKFLLMDMSSDICGAIIEPLCDNYEHEQTMVVHKEYYTDCDMLGRMGMNTRSISAQGLLSGIRAPVMLLMSLSSVRITSGSYLNLWYMFFSLA
ncbi:Hypothetical predicted protein [Olea europaea subsp. europaea]|uniref:Uncharacterized protein n=1 Tax=Olea europaea subsp. europaea TaxID=158383 RepID=A0A8S0SW08_OLEEU|nr:Hypothetical predicted protein [Olea europaea subsp. europaea]